MRPAFYALTSGGWRDYVTILHLPFTAWHLGYVVLGAAAAPVVSLPLTGWTVLAFFLAVGLGAHALDELHGRPLGTRIPSRVLAAIALLSVAGAVGVGLYLTLVVSPWTAAFVLFGGFIVWAYNLEVWGGKFHSDVWFGVAWGAFPAVVGYWVNAASLDLPVLLVAAGCFFLSLAQRKLSSQARKLRREAREVRGYIRYRDGRSHPLTASDLISAPEFALRALSVAVPLLALGWLLANL